MDSAHGEFPSSTRTASFGELRTRQIPVSMLSVEGCSTSVAATIHLRFRPFLLEITTLLHAFRLLARVFVVGSFAVIFLVAGSLLHGELARAWAGEIRRLVKRDHS